MTQPWTVRRPSPSPPCPTSTGWNSRPTRRMERPGSTSRRPSTIRSSSPPGPGPWSPPESRSRSRPRSGLALKHGITCLNTPGTIDSDYRGELKVILANLGPEPFAIESGMRIAQAVLCPVYQISWQEVDSLDATVRGAGGFGSTGTGG